MLTDITIAVPPYIVKQDFAADELKKRMGGGPVFSRMIDMASNLSGIDQRHFVIPDGEPDAANKFYTRGESHFSPDTDSRMKEYEKWSVQLAKKAVHDLALRNQIDFRKLDRIITISCTGFFAPGLDYQLINEFKISPDVKRVNIGFMGCAASLIGINSIGDLMKAGITGNALMVSVELCSLHLQTEPNRDNILANMIFADGAAAAYFAKTSKPGKPGLEIIFSESFLFDDSAKFMGWTIGNNGFEMVLSSELPKIILNSAAPKITELLTSKGTGINEVKHWALHPGGRAILDALKTGLQLSDDQLKPSREILKSYGNLSSVSILFVLNNIMSSNKLNSGDLCCAVAFGPGLTMEIVMFRVG